MGPTGGRRARAAVSTHVTGAFLPRTEARDPRARGSLGVGLVLEARVVAEATWLPAKQPRLSVVSDAMGPLPISTEVARRLSSRRPGALAVRLSHPLPIGQGFGTSAAGALATALSVASVLGTSRRAATETAHLAELFGGGGLGGVASVLGGGLEERVRPGLPPFGRVVRHPFAGPVLVGVVGRPIPSPSILANPRLLARIAGAYARVKETAGPATAESFWDASEGFTDRLALAPRELRDLLRGIRQRGGRAAQAMFGRSFFSRLPTGPRRAELVRWLAGRPVRAVELGVARRGPTLRTGAAAHRPGGPP